MAEEAYYLFLGMYPRDESGFTKRELALLKQASGVVAITKNPFRS